MRLRQTIAREIAVTGTALHAGVRVTMRFVPAPAEQGVVFRRADLGKDIPARHDLVVETRLGTVLEKDGARVGVVEHVLAAVAGAGVDDLTIVLDGPEPPILDGDALSYLVLIEDAGLRDLPVPCTTIEVLEPVDVAQGEGRATLSPGAGRVFDLEIVFANPAIGRQHLCVDLAAESFRTAIAPARTFGFLKELESLNAMGLARGASLQNTLALGDSGVVNRALQRFPDEFVRHKILDAVGDMMLAGAPVLGRFSGVRSGHALNNALLRALFATPGAFRRVTFA